MTPGIIGLIIGLFFGVVGWRTLKILADRVDKPETKRVLGIMGGVELVLMPAIGYVIGTLLFDPGIQGPTP